MDTAVIKSWNEVLRLTDPLIWNLAMDMDETHELGHCNGDSIGFGNGSNGLHGNNGQSNGTIISHAQLKHSPTTLLPSKDSLSPSPSPSSSSSSSSSSTSPSSPDSSHIAPNYCRSLLDPHPKNALDWLKCLVIQTTDNEKDSSHETQKKELRSLLSRTSVDLGPAGAGKITFSGGGLIFRLGEGGVLKWEQKHGFSSVSFSVSCPHNTHRTWM